MMIQCASFAIINEIEIEIEGRTMDQKEKEYVRSPAHTEARLKKTVATA